MFLTLVLDGVPYGSASELTMRMYSRPKQSIARHQLTVFAYNSPQVLKRVARSRSIYDKWLLLEWIPTHVVKTHLECVVSCC